MSDKSDYLFFDIMADLSFGKSFEIKEDGENGIKIIPKLIHSYMAIMNSASSPSIFA